MIQPALVAALAELTNPVKNCTANAGQYSYKYADLSSIIDHVRPILAKHELAITQNVMMEEARLEVTTNIHHSSGEVLTFGPLIGRGSASWQDMGSAITYMRRYSLSAALGIAPEDDNDGATATPPITISDQAVKDKAKAAARKVERVKVSHSDLAIIDDPWATDAPEEDESLKPAVALVAAQFGGVIFDEEHPIRGPHMMEDPPSEKQKITLNKCLDRGSKELGITELEYLNAVLSDVGYPQVTGIDVVGKRACSAIFDHLFGRDKK